MRSKGQTNKVINTLLSPAWLLQKDGKAMDGRDSVTQFLPTEQIQQAWAFTNVDGCYNNVHNLLFFLPWELFSPPQLSGNVLPAKGNDSKILRSSMSQGG